MCLVVLALGVHERFPLVLASNRDEFFDRPAQALQWWQPGAGAPPILGGRDLQGGGTWMGLSPSGRVALVTNVRNPRDPEGEAPSRGEIVPGWLRGDAAIADFAPRFLARNYKGVNLLAGDLRGDAADWTWLSNRPQQSRMLKKGLWGLSNAGLDTPWPKVERLKQQVQDALDKANTAEELSAFLFAALSDPTPAPEALLPRTGVSLEWERWLSPIFIRTPDGRYGTRCSTLLITERIGARLVSRMIERSFASMEAPEPGERCMLLPNWPPRLVR